MGCYGIACTGFRLGKHSPGTRQALAWPLLRVFTNDPAHFDNRQAAPIVVVYFYHSWPVLRNSLFPRHTCWTIGKITLDHEGGEFPVIATLDKSEVLVAYTQDERVVVRKVNR